MRISLMMYVEDILRVSYHPWYICKGILPWIYIVKDIVITILGNMCIKYITRCTHSTRALACGFLIIIKSGLILNSFIKGAKSRLNSFILSNTTLRGYGYLISPSLINNWITLVDYLSMYSSFIHITSSILNVKILTISNQPVSGFTVVIQMRLTYFLIISPPGWCCLIELIYGPIKTIYIISHGFRSAMILGGRCLWRVFLLLNCWYILHDLAYRSACVKRPFRYHTYRVLFASLLPPGLLR